jgi:hypothetical protein
VLEKKTRIVNEKILEDVRSQPCCACGIRPSDPHHVTSVGAGGDDTALNVMPLCRRHHAMVHNRGMRTMIRIFWNMRQWIEKHGRQDVLERIEKRSLCG